MIPGFSALLIFDLSQSYCYLRITYLGGATYFCSLAQLCYRTCGMETDSSSFSIPDFVGAVDLSEIPQDRRLRHLQQAFSKLGRRPIPKTASVRDRHEEELSQVAITISLAESALAEAAPAARFA